MVGYINEDAMLKAMLRDAYFAGFMDSAEGWNGEYPFAQENEANKDRLTGDDPADLEKQFDRWYRRKRASNG